MTNFKSKSLQTFSEAILSATNQDEQDRIWGSIQSPIIEDIADDLKHKLVTFLYRLSSEELRNETNIYLYSNMTGLPCSKEGQFSIIPQTDIAYLSLMLPSELKTTYACLKVDNTFSMESPIDSNPDAINYPIPTGQFAASQNLLNRLFEESRVVIDPKNPKEIIYYKDYDHPIEYYAKESVLELPLAPKLEGIPESLEVIKLQRDQLKQSERLIEDVVQFSETSLNGVIGYQEGIEATRKYWIYYPPGYKQEVVEHYPLILFLDGSDYLNPIPTPSILEKLISEEIIPPCIAVFLEYSSTNRMQEYNCDAQFSNFLAHDFMGLLRKKHQLKITQDPKLITIVGLSASGLSAFYTALTHPTVFGNVIAQSPSFEMRKTEEIEQMIEEHAHLNQETQFVLEIGTYETIPIELEFQDGRTQALSSYEANIKTYEHIIQNQLHVSRHEFTGGHDYVSWRISLGNHLKEIFAHRLKMKPQCKFS